SMILFLLLYHSRPRMGSTLFPYTTLFRSWWRPQVGNVEVRRRWGLPVPAQQCAAQYRGRRRGVLRCSDRREPQKYWTVCWALGITSFRVHIMAQVAIGRPAVHPNCG